MIKMVLLIRGSLAIRWVPFSSLIIDKTSVFSGTKKGVVSRFSVPFYVRYKYTVFPFKWLKIGCFRVKLAAIMWSIMMAKDGRSKQTILSSKMDDFRQKKRRDGWMMMVIHFVAHHPSFWPSLFSFWLDYLNLTAQTSSFTHFSLFFLKVV